MNPFSKYIDCINCGNELTHVSELTFRTPSVITCDYCGQQYKGLSRRIRKTKRSVTVIFILLAVLLAGTAWLATGITAALFALFPLFVVYLFVLGTVIRKSLKF